MKLTPCGWAFLRAEPQVGVRKKQTIKHTPNMLRIAIQAKGRLNEQSIDLLSEAGIRVAESKRKLISRAEGFPLEVLYLRDDDIPQAVSMGVADLGIVGLNEVAEKGFPVEQIMDLGFGGCRLSLAVPNAADYTGPDYFRGRRVATSYPNILRGYFARQGIEVEREARPVHIAELTLLEYNENEKTGKLHVTCSKGTYIRTLIEDIAQKCGTVGAMTALRRTAACGFTLADAVSLDTLKAMKENGESFDEILRPVEKLFSMLTAVSVTPAQAQRYLNGGALTISRCRAPKLSLIHI